MDPVTLFRALTPLRKLIVAALVAAALLWAFLFVRDLFTGSAKVEARLGNEQAGAAIQSGQDAASTVGEQAKIEAERERSVAEMQKDVNDAENSSDAHAAGADWLCLDFGICAEK